MSEKSISDAKDEKELRAILASQGWTIGEGDTIRDPGKFEGEFFMTLYFWDLVLNGFSDEEEYDEYDRPISVFNIGKEEWESFPSLKGIKKLMMWEDDQGFVRTDWES